MKRIRVFDSYARGEATAESDLALLLDMEHPVGFAFFDWARNLEDQLGITVGVEAGVSDYTMRYIQRGFEDHL